MSADPITELSGQGGAMPFDLERFNASGNRWPYYRSWRDHAPVLRVPPSAPTTREAVILTRYADVAGILRARDTQVSPDGHPDPKHLGEGASATMYRVRMVLTDPPQHTRLRKLAAPAFTPKAIAGITDSIRAAVEANLDELQAHPTADIVKDFASHVPATVVCSILGIDMEPHGKELIARTADYANIFSPFPLDAETFARCEAACAYYIEWFTAFVEEHRTRRGSGIVNALLEAEEQGSRLTTIELVGLLHAFLSAGYQTTMNAIVSGVFGLLEQRDKYDWLRANPDAIPHAVDEILRWDGPVHFARRYLTAPLELHGSALESGTEVLLCLASANRDERKFPAPDELQLERPNAAEHVAFGGGRHICIGAYFARLEATIALSALLRRFPDMQLIDTDPPHRRQFVFPLYERLEVELGRAAEPTASAPPSTDV
jgi:cytochrome P450